MRMSGALVAAIMAVEACGGGSAAVATPSPTPYRRTVERADLAHVLELATALTYKLTYSMNGKINGVAFAGRWITYQRGSLRRVDISDGMDAASFYLGGTTAVVCPLPFKPPCTQSTVDEVTHKLGVGLEDLLRENIALFDMAVLREDRIGGHDVTCFDIRPDDAGKLSPGTRQIDVCYTAEGIPMRIELKDSTVELALEGQLLLDDFAESDVQVPADALGAP